MAARSEQQASIAPHPASSDKAVDPNPFESESRFRAIFENSGSGMALVDAQGHPVKLDSR